MSSYASTMSITSLDKWAAVAGREFFGGGSATDMDVLTPVAASLPTTGAGASTGPPELNMSFSSLDGFSGLLSPGVMGDAFPLDGPDGVAAVAMAALEEDPAVGGKVMEDGDAPPTIPFHVVLANARTGVPRASCSWISFKGTLVEDVMRAGHPTRVTFRAIASPNAADSGALDEEAVPKWSTDANTFRFNDTELSVALPTFNPKIFKLSAESQEAASGHVAVHVTVSCKADALEASGEGVATWNQDVMLAILQVQPLMNDDDDI